MNKQINWQDDCIPKECIKSLRRPIEREEPKITHTLFISGKVKDVQAQLTMMCKQFPNATIKQMLEQYNLKSMVLQ